MTTRERFKKEQVALVARLTVELARYRSELAELEANGLGGDFKAMQLREGIPATEYLLALETADLAVEMPDMRFTCRNRPAIKGAK